VCEGDVFWECAPLLEGLQCATTAPIYGEGTDVWPLMTTPAIPNTSAPPTSQFESCYEWSSVVGTLSSPSTHTFSGGERACDADRVWFCEDINSPSLC